MCPATLILNLTLLWTKVDIEHLQTATARCKTLYTDAPCLKKFTKVEELTYRAICGQKEKTK